MRILYAVQATGNGHISRAVQLLPYLQQYGKVDIFLSGANAQLQQDLPIRYRSKGLSLFYSSRGALHYQKIAAQANPFRLCREIRDLPVEKYDMVINDFEAITALACRYKKIPSVNFGHQAAFQSQKVPRPATKEWLGEALLKHYALAPAYLGLHFKKYDEFIFEPVIKQEILRAQPENKGHFTIYLSSYRDEFLLPRLHRLRSFRFQLFSRQVKQITQNKNVTLLPVNQQLFNESMIRAYGVITGAGFETPAEVLHLGKKLMVIPIRGQYEQACNAAALKEFGVTVLEKIDENFQQAFLDWIGSPAIPKMEYSNQVPEILNYLVENYPANGNVPLDLLLPDLMIA